MVIIVVAVLAALCFIISTSLLFATIVARQNLRRLRRKDAWRDFETFTKYARELEAKAAEAQKYYTYQGRRDDKSVALLEHAAAWREQAAQRLREETVHDDALGDDVLEEVSKWRELRRKEYRRLAEAHEPSRKDEAHE